MEPNLSVSFSIFVGVISGIITSILIWVIVELFKNTILPWYQLVIYRGQKVTGDWDGYAFFLKKKAEKFSIIHLEQKGNNIIGDLTLIKQPDGERVSKKYDLKGLFYDNSLVLTYEVADKTRFGLGACVFRLVDDGQKLDGYWTAVNTLSSNVFSFAGYWKRKK